MADLQRSDETASEFFNRQINEANAALAAARDREKGLRLKANRLLDEVEREVALGHIAGEICLAAMELEAALAPETHDEGRG